MTDHDEANATGPDDAVHEDESDLTLEADPVWLDQSAPASTEPPAPAVARRDSPAPVTATTPVVRSDRRHRTHASTKIVLAAIAATAVAAIVWLLVGGETADAPPVVDPSSTVDATQPASSRTGPGSTIPSSTPP
jgi:hypothetical protein